MVCLLFGAVANTVAGYENETERRLQLDAGSIETLKIDSGQGFLKIKGVKGLDRIEVQATITVKNADEGDMERFVEKSVELTLEKQGSKAKLISRFNRGVFSSIFGKRSGRIDLTVRVPYTMALDIEDGSGLIEVSDIGGNVDLDDGSGSLEMHHVNGNVRIDDGSGSIDISDISGNVEIEDGSGSITMKKVGGDVSIDDNSGSIQVYDIGGSVVVDDGSGGITIDGVDKDVEIKRAGSGGVSIDNVKGIVKR
jgi:DUF4097 and DUF4098 domain-containing protein YvlB